MMQPCERLDIPIEVRKTSLATDDPFTLISKESTLVAAISAIRAVAVLEISGPGMKVKTTNRKGFLILCYFWTNRVLLVWLHQFLELWQLRMFRL